MFGFLHVLLSLFQQLFNATLLGIVLGLLAVRSRSILPGILFHFLNNAIAVVAGVPGRKAAGRCLVGRLDLSQPERTGFIMCVWVAAGVRSSRPACSSASGSGIRTIRLAARCTSQPVEPACRSC